MGTTLFTPANHEQFLARLKQITSESERCWGQITPTGLMAHLHRTFELSLGDVKVEDQSNIFTRTIIRWLFFYVLPWPKGKIKAPEGFTPEPEGNFESEKERLIAIMDRYLAAQTAEPQRSARNPFFGAMTLTTWGRLHGLHLDHHLRQFGV